jgi:hypothetical protein
MLKKQPIPFLTKSLVITFITLQPSILLAKPTNQPKIELEQSLKEFFKENQKDFTELKTMLLGQELDIVGLDTKNIISAKNVKYHEPYNLLTYKETKISKERWEIYQALMKKHKIEKIQRYTDEILIYCSFPIKAASHTYTNVSYSYRISPPSNIVEKVSKPIAENKEGLPHYIALENDWYIQIK